MTHFLDVVEAARKSDEIELDLLGPSTRSTIRRMMHPDGAASCPHDLSLADLVSRCHTVSRTRSGYAANPARQQFTGTANRLALAHQVDVQLRRGWGTFGFANSLFNNPKEPGVDENLSDQWFEGYVKPALSASYTLASSSEIYGKVSAVGERTYGSVPAAFGQDVSSFGPEDLYIGWRSGKSLTIGENALDFIVGRAQYRSARLPALRRRVPKAAAAAATGPTRARRSSSRRSAAFKPGPHTVEVFYLDKDELEESDSGSRLWGANYEFSIGENTTLGATYMKWFADAEIKPERDGLNVFNLRAYTAPCPDIARSVVRSSSTRRSATATRSTRTRGRSRARMSSATSTWKPKLSYRYAFFQGDDPATAANEAFDPLFLGFYDWGTWWQGEIAGEYFLSNSNLKSHLVRVARGAERRRRRRADVLQVQPRSAGDRSARR